MRVVIADDDRLVCTALKTILEASGINVMGIGYSGEEAVCLYERFEPDILLMDIRMNGMNGIEAAKKIIEKYHNAKILFLTTFADDEYIVSALKLGAKGYLLKQNFESIVPALTAVETGQSIFGDQIVSKLPRMMNSGGKADLSGLSLTERESEIIMLVADGLNNKEISKRMFLSEGTVKNYISSILEKLDLRDRTQLAIFYYKNL